MRCTGTPRSTTTFIATSSPWSHESEPPEVAAEAASLLRARALWGWDDRWFVGLSLRGGSPPRGAAHGHTGAGGGMRSAGSIMDATLPAVISAAFRCTSWAILTADRTWLIGTS